MLSDNDTTSAFYYKTKTHIFEMIKKDISSFQYLKDPDCQPDKVAQIVERFLISLYRGSITKKVSNLDALRYELYSGMVITWTPVNGHGRKMEMFCRQYVR